MRHNITLSLLLLLPCLFIGQSRAAPSETELLQQLRADHVVLLQAMTEFGQTYQGVKSGSSEQDDFAAWIRQLSYQLVQGCLELSRISTKPLPDDLPCDQLHASQPAPAAINIAGESTEAENTARMIDQLNGSLGEFDERLLREQDRVKAKKPRTETASASSEGGASGDSGDPAEASNGEQGKEGQTGNAAGQSNQDGGAAGDKGASSSGKGVQGRPSPGVKSSAPADIPDGSNDDVIARQLREAAEKETDPELKRKLWDEYRRYKSGEM